MLAIRGLMGDREIASASLPSVLASVPASTAENPIFLIGIREVGLVAPQINPEVLSFKPYRPPPLFELEQSLVDKYHQRLEVLERKEKIQEDLKTTSNESLRNSKRLELDEAMQQEAKIRDAERETSIRNKQREEDQSTKIKRLMAETGLKVENDARFYLESQNWNLQAAIQFVRSEISQESFNNVNITFNIPGVQSFTHPFKSNELLWSMLTIVHRRIQQISPNRPFKLKYRGELFTEEKMARMNFEQAGIRDASTIEVIWAK